MSPAPELWEERRGKRARRNSRKARERGRLLDSVFVHAQARVTRQEHTARSGCATRPEHQTDRSGCATQSGDTRARRVRHQATEIGTKSRKAKAHSQEWLCYNT